MSYPEPRHLGENGEINAVFRAADTSPDVVSPGGTVTHYLASHVSTGGEFGLYKVDMGPKAPGAKTHFHRTISESFDVQNGPLRTPTAARDQAPLSGIITRRISESG